MELGDLDCPEPIADILDAGEPPGLRIPPPRRKMNPAVTGDRQREVDRPAKG
jgi:hypothetical protein